MQDRVQFNVRIKPSLQRKVALERINTKASHDTIASNALEAWFAGRSADERAKFYRNHDRKAF